MKKLLFEKRELEEKFMSQLQDEIVSNSEAAKLNDEICKMRDLALKEVVPIVFKPKFYFQNFKFSHAHFLGGFAFAGTGH